MKRIISLALLLCLFILDGTVCFSKEDIFKSASSAAVFDTMTEEFIYEKNSRKKRPVASTTKIMTALIAFENEKGEEFPVPLKAVNKEGSSMGLKKGDTVTLEKLSAGMLLSSGNDAAEAAAFKISGNVRDFVSLMNERAKKYGMEDTSFSSPSGLDEGENLSTARDMALLAFEAMKNDGFRKLAGTKTKKLDLKTRNIYLKNHNRLLWEDENFTGIKTGFTKKAGRCLVSSKKVMGREFIIVTLNCPDDFSAHSRAYKEIEKHLSEIDLSSLFKGGKITVTGGRERNTSVMIKDEGKRALFKSEISSLSTDNILPPFLYAPLKHNEKAGEFVVKIKEKTVLTLPVYTSSGVELKEEESIMKKGGSFIRELLHQ